VVCRTAVPVPASGSVRAPLRVAVLLPLPQYRAPLIGRQLFRLNDFVFDGLQIVVIEVELPLQRSIGDTLFPLEPIDNLRQQFLEGHGSASPVSDASPVLIDCGMSYKKGMRQSCFVRHPYITEKAGKVQEKTPTFSKMSNTCTG
jgi:hypothetical protein